MGSFGDSSKPNVIVLQEWWGVTNEIKIQAGRIADAGFHAVVPDLYRGKIGVEAEEAEHLVNDLDWMGALEDIRSGADHLSEQNGQKVGVTGFCMGGALAIAGATHVESISCGAPFYGVGPKELADPATCNVPMQAHFGNEDKMAGFSDPEVADALEKSFQEAGIEYDVFRYDGVSHGFMNDTDYAIERADKLGFTGGDTGASFNRKIVELAYSRLFSFFKKHL